MNLVPAHGPYLAFLIGLASAATNYFTTLTLFDGDNPYFFIGDWRTGKSPLMVDALSFVFIVVYYLFARLLERKLSAVSHKSD